MLSFHGRNFILLAIIATYIDHGKTDFVRNHKRLTGDVAGPFPPIPSCHGAFPTHCSRGIGQLKRAPNRPIEDEKEMGTITLTPFGKLPDQASYVSKEWAQTTIQDGLSHALASGDVMHEHRSIKPTRQPRIVSLL